MTPARNGGWNVFVRFHHRRHTNGLHLELPTTKASRPASPLDIYWAAGFLEGEGSFQSRRTSDCVIYEVACQQVQREPLDRMREFFGGRVHILTARRDKAPVHTWKVSGVRARGVMMTLYPIMSPRRQGQITTALGRFA